MKNMLFDLKAKRSFLVMFIFAIIMFSHLHGNSLFFGPSFKQRFLSTGDCENIFFAELSDEPCGFESSDQQKGVFTGPSFKDRSSILSFKDAVSLRNHRMAVALLREAQDLLSEACPEYNQISETIAGLKKFLS